MIFKKCIKLYWLVTTIFLSEQVFASPQKIHQNFIGTWCDGEAQALEITKSHLIAIEGRGKYLINIQELSANTPNIFAGVFRVEHNDKLILTSYELKNNKLYEYTNIQGNLYTTEFYECEI